jgi:hypothetical protein
MIEIVAYLSTLSRNHHQALTPPIITTWTAHHPAYVLDKPIQLSSLPRYAHDMHTRVHTERPVETRDRDKAARVNSDQQPPGMSQGFDIGRRGQRRTTDSGCKDLNAECVAFEREKDATATRASGRSPSLFFDDLQELTTLLESLKSLLLPPDSSQAISLLSPSSSLHLLFVKHNHIISTL